MPDIRQSLLIAADARTVYDALTTRKGLRAWWTPEADAEPAIGTTARFPFGPHYTKAMDVIALEPAALVGWRCTGGAAEWIGTTITFRLTAGPWTALRAAHGEMGGQIDQQPGDRGTLVAFAHEGWPAATPGFAECSYTWGRFLFSLKLYCETGRGTPWPDQHRLPGAAR